MVDLAVQVQLLVLVLRELAREVHETLLWLLVPELDVHAIDRAALRRVGTQDVRSVETPADLAQVLYAICLLRRLKVRVVRLRALIIATEVVNAQLTSMPRRLASLDAAYVRLIDLLAGSVPLENVVHEALHTVVVNALCLQLKQRRVGLCSVVRYAIRSLVFLRLCNRCRPLSRTRATSVVIVRHWAILHPGLGRIGCSLHEALLRHRPRSHSAERTVLRLAVLVVDDVGLGAVGLSSYIVLGRALSHVKRATTFYLDELNLRLLPRIENLLSLRLLQKLEVCWRLRRRHRLLLVAHSWTQLLATNLSKLEVDGWWWTSLQTFTNSIRIIVLSVRTFFRSGIARPLQVHTIAGDAYVN